jgi:hypothetical protein
MRKRGWSVGRLMVAIAFLAVGLAALSAVDPRRNDWGIGALDMVLALILAAVTDRALFGRSYRAFWLGFAATAWLCAITAINYRLDFRHYLLGYGPAIVRARQDFQMAHANAVMRGGPPPPPVSELYLVSSLLAELGLGLVLGALVASVGGLFALAVALFARRTARLAQRLNVPDRALGQSEPIAASRADD